MIVHDIQSILTNNIRYDKFHNVLYHDFFKIFVKICL